MEQSIKSVLVKQTLAHQQQQQKSLQRHQAIVLMCRVYVGSISFELKEETIRAAFAVFGTIKTINMSFDPLTQKHKGFAFVEYELPEAAQLALDQMNGFLMGGRNIKVGRPSNMPQAAPIIEQINQEAKNYNRVYISNILQGITEQDVYLVFEAFGKIKSCTLIQSSVPGKHKGYCFIEYETEQSAMDAIVSMNLFDLGGQQIRVGRAITPPNCLDSTPPASTSALPTASALAAAAITAQITALEVTGAASALPTTTIQNNKTSSGLSLSTITLAPNAIQPVNAKNVAGVITGVTLNQSTSTNHQNSHSILPPPTLITNLPLPSSLSNSSSSSTLINNGNSNGLLSSTNNNTNNSKQDNKLNQANSIVDELQSLQQQENMSIKGANARQMLMQKLMRKIESKVVMLKNMVTVDEIDEELESEVTDECSKFGSVTRVVIFQEKQDLSDDAEVIVKIFVEFEQGSSAIKARDSLNGRYFAGRIVQAELFEENLDSYFFSG